MSTLRSSKQRVQKHRYLKRNNSVKNDGKSPEEPAAKKEYWDGDIPSSHCRVSLDELNLKSEINLESDAEDTISEVDDPLRVQLTSCQQSRTSPERKHFATTTLQTPIEQTKSRSAVRYDGSAGVQQNVESDEDDASEDGFSQVDEPPGYSNRKTMDGVEKRRPVYNLEEMLEVILKNQEESEKRLMKKIDFVKRSIVHDVKNIMENVITNIHSALGVIHGTNITKHEAVLGIRLPTETMEEFDNLELSLGVAEKRTAMKVIMSVRTTGKTQLSAAIGNIMSHIMSKPVQLQYSAYGRKTFVGGKKIEKRNFSTTQACKCMLEVLIEAYSGSEKIILSCTSRWLSGAGDRENGRSQRTANEKFLKRVKM